MYFVYILRCSDQSLYVGHTSNVTKRLTAHNAGRGAAVRRERQLKRWTRRKKEALIRGDLDLLHTLSVRRN